MRGEKLITWASRFANVLEGAGSAMRSLDSFVKRKRKDAIWGVGNWQDGGPDPHVSEEVLAEVGACKLKPVHTDVKVPSALFAFLCLNRSQTRH